MESTCNTSNKNILYFLRPGLPGLFLFYKFCLSFAFGFKPNISEIKIIGLSKTKQSVIEREIYHKSSSPLDSSIAELDRNRIFNLGLFDEVSWRVIPTEDGDAILQFNEAGTRRWQIAVDGTDDYIKFIQEYSPSFRAAMELPQEKGTYNQMRSMLLKRGAKEEELIKKLNEAGLKVESLVNTVGHQYTVICSKKV